MKAMFHLVILCVLQLAGVAQAVTCVGNIPAGNPDVIYTDHGDGTVTDSRTGLMWKKCSEGQTGHDCTGNSMTAFTWAEALVHAEAHTFAGHDDWRLPNIRELDSLVEECRFTPAINDAHFPNTPSSYFWSGSPYANFSSYARVVYFFNGNSGGSNREDGEHVRLVRGGQSSVLLTPPATPVVPVAGDGTQTAGVPLTWTDVGGADGSLAYQVYRCTSTATATCGTALAAAAAGTQYADATALPGTLYYYRLKACNSAGCSDFSPTDTGWRKFDSIMPSASSNLAGQVRVDWTAPANATGSTPAYKIFRASSATGTQTQLNATLTTELTYSDTTAASGSSYWYWVQACSSDGLRCGDLSTSAMGTTVAIPSTPAAPVASDGTQTLGVQLNWTDAGGPGTPLTYQVFRCTNTTTSSCGTVIPGAAAGTMVSDTTAVPGTLYYYRLKACNAAGCSDLSLADSGWRNVESLTVTGVTPLTATLNLATTFTVTGSNLTAGMGFALADCAPSNAEVNTGTSTMRYFRCTPTLAGAKAGAVSTEPGGSSLHTFTVTVAPYTARPLNDTGIQFCGAATSGNNTPCLGTDPSGQDAHYGRDALAAAGQLEKIGSGSAGFDFTALDASGNPTTPSSGATPHACVRDNVTGLVWEVKTDDGGLRDQDWTYTWYKTDSPDGNPGTASGGNCRTAGRCDTEKYVADVNAAGLCGHNDWRMPTVKELEGIADLGRAYLAIDPSYFPNTPSSYFWSGSPYAYDSSDAWVVDFYLSPADSNGRSYGEHVRLVRGGQ